uniref:Reverse transcriptase/retrotransposon-derived protein RNase H-like domain-containing protein n=1 Tax=Xiphophorus maculatus TaxID=8083 RepID=A0A3B5QIB0_XIPMA
RDPDLLWTDEAEEALCRIKQALVSSTALSLPNYKKPFVQMVDCRGHFMTSVLVQQHGDKMRPVAYFSSKLDKILRVIYEVYVAISEALPWNEGTPTSQYVT